MPIYNNNGYSDLFNDNEADELVEADDLYVNNVYELDTGGGINFNNETYFYDKLNIQTMGQNKYTISGGVTASDRNYYIKDMGVDSDFVLSNGVQVVRDKTFIDCNYNGSINFSDIVCNSIVSNTVSADFVDVIDKTFELNYMAPSNGTAYSSFSFYQLFLGKRGYLEQLQFNLATDQAFSSVTVRISILDSNDVNLNEKFITVDDIVTTRTINYEQNEIVLNEGEIYKIRFDDFPFSVVTTYDIGAVYIANGFSLDENGTLNFYVKITQSNKLTANTIINTTITGQNLSYINANITHLNFDLMSGNTINANLITANSLTGQNLTYSNATISNITISYANILNGINSQSINNTTYTGNILNANLIFSDYLTSNLIEVINRNYTLNFLSTQQQLDLGPYNNVYIQRFKAIENYCFLKSLSIIIRSSFLSFINVNVDIRNSQNQLIASRTLLNVNNNFNTYTTNYNDNQIPLVRGEEYSIVVYRVSGFSNLVVYYSNNFYYQGSFTPLTSVTSSFSVQIQTDRKIVANTISGTSISGTNLNYTNATLTNGTITNGTINNVSGTNLNYTNGNIINGNVSNLYCNSINATNGNTSLNSLNGNLYISGSPLIILTSTNNQLGWYYGGFNDGTFVQNGSITLTPGSYTLQQISTLIQSQFNSIDNITPNNWSVIVAGKQLWFQRQRGPYSFIGSIFSAIGMPAGFNTGGFTWLGNSWSYSWPSGYDKCNDSIELVTNPYKNISMLNDTVNGLIINSSGIGIGGDVLPLTTGTNTLGSNLKKWLTLYSSSIDVGNAYVSGDVSCSRIDFGQGSYLGYYKTATFSISFTGCASITVNNIQIERIGSTVFMKIPAFTVTSASTNALFGGVSIPSQFRPVSDCYCPIVVNQSGYAQTQTLGTVQIKADGSLTIFRNYSSTVDGYIFTASFTSGRVVGLPGDATLTWKI